MKGFIIGLAVGLLLVPISVLAVDPVIRDEVREIDVIEKGETVVVSGRTVIIDQELVGDVFILADRAEIRGRIDGDLSVVAREVKVKAEVTGNVTIAGLFISHSGSVQGTSMEAGVQVTFDASVVDAFIVGLGMDIGGSSSGAIWTASNQTRLHGVRAETIHSMAPVIIVDDDAVIKNLNHTGRVAPVIGENNNVDEVDFKQTPVAAFFRFKGALAYVAIFLARFIWMLGITLTLWFFANRSLDVLRINLSKGIWGNLVRGVIIALSIPLIIYAAIWSAVGIQLGLLIVLLLIIIGHAGFAAAALLLGNRIMSLISKDHKSDIRSILIGTTALAALTLLPYVGSIILILITVLGWGTLTKVLWQARLKRTS